MTPDLAKSLADEVIAGTYVPSSLDDCAGHLPVDRSAQVVRIQQFMLFGDPRADIRSPNEARYRIFQQYETSDATAPADLVKGVVKPLAAAVANIPNRQQPVTRDPQPAATGTRVARSRTRSEVSAPSTASDGMPRLIHALRQAGFSPGAVAARGSFDDVLVGVLTPVILPAPYQPFRDPHPHIALLVTLEQVWEPKGYTRGELIKTIGLAPGEDVTLEFHTWDKTTYKSQEDLVEESETKISQTATQRDALTVARERATQTGGRLNVGATIPIKAATVTLGGEASTQVSANTKQTAEHSQQSTVDASNTLKTARKVNIEISRDTGREDKQTRRVTNTNRCHSLSCHYFEVLANYMVSVRLASLQPCLLLPTPRAQVTPPWVLCHEAILKSALLDSAYLAGFRGAQLLESQNAFAEIHKVRGSVANEFDAELKLLLADILDSFGQLTAIADIASWPLWLALADLQTAGQQGSLGTATYTSASAANYAGNLPADATPIDGPIVLRRLLYFVLVAANERLLHALRRLRKNKGASKAALPLRMFFASVAAHDYHVTVSSAAVAKGLAALGLPTDLFDALTSWNLADLVPNDAGLCDALAAAEKRLDEIWSLPTAAGPAPSAQGYSDMDVAGARASFEQLRCHIEDNWLHYAKAMWLDEDPDARFLRLQGYGAVAAVLDTAVLGFLGHKQAFAITSLDAVSRVVDFTALIDQATTQFEADAPAPRLVAMPTGGTVLETIVGECDACEDFIEQSRVFDLRMQAAKAAQEESEAKRRQMRLDLTPPNLDFSGGPDASNVSVNVNPAPAPAPAAAPA